MATPLPSPPFVPVDGVPNFRDLGGYSIKSASSPRSIRSGLVYRSAEPSQVTPAGITRLKSLGITHVYDLRSKREIEKGTASGRGQITEWDGAERLFVPVFSELSYSPESIALRYQQYASEGTEGFTRAYAEILKNASSSYRTMLLHLANEPDKPLLLHCTAGKDRTGVFCALVLSLCGVDDDTVALEYSFTELGLAEYRETIKEHLLANPALNYNKAGALNMLSARAPNMLATLKMVKEEYGGAEGYFERECGLTKDNIDRIRQNLIHDGDAMVDTSVL